MKNLVVNKKVLRDNISHELDKYYKETYNVIQLDYYDVINFIGGIDEIMWYNCNMPIEYLSDVLGEVLKDTSRKSGELKLMINVDYHELSLSQLSDILKDFADNNDTVSLMISANSNSDCINKVDIYATQMTTFGES